MSRPLFGFYPLCFIYFYIKNLRECSTQDNPCCRAGWIRNQPHRKGWAKAYFKNQQALEHGGGAEGIFVSEVSVLAWI